MAWSPLLNNQWVSANDLQDAVTTGVFILLPGQSIPTTDEWVTRFEVETWIDAIVTNGTSNQWPQKSWIIPNTTTTTSTSTTSSSTSTTTTTLPSVQGFQTGAAGPCDYLNFPDTKYIGGSPRIIYDDSLGSTITAQNYKINLPAEGFIKSWIASSTLIETDDSASTVAYPSSVYERPRSTSIVDGVVTGQTRYVKVVESVEYQVTYEITSSTNTSIPWEPWAFASNASGTNLISSAPTYMAVVGTYTANFIATSCQSVNAQINATAAGGDGVVTYTVKVEAV